MSRENVSHRVKLSINSLTVAGLIATFVLVTATAALGGIHLPGQQPTPEFTPSHDYVFHDQYDLYAFNTIRPKLLDEGRSYFFPPPPPKPKPVVHHAPGVGIWGRLANCESGSNPSTNTGNGYYGMYQFTPSTWRATGGQGMPHHASPAEQTKRAQIAVQRWGWGQFPACARKLGLR